MLTGFAQEARSYLPHIRAGIESFLHDAHEPAVLEDAYQHVHWLKGAAEMLELAVLSQMTSAIEEMVGEVATGSSPLEPIRAACLQQAVHQLEDYLEHWLSDDSRAQVCALEIDAAFRRFQGLASPDDQAASADTSTVPDALATPTASEPVSPRATTSAPGPQDEVSSELIEGFFLEAEDHLNTVGGLLPTVGYAPAQHDNLQQVRRSIHTFKGAAGVVGFRAVSQLAHRMEDGLDALYVGSYPCTAQITDLLLATFDALDEFVRTRGHMAHFDQTAEELYRSYATLLDTTPAVAAVAAVPGTAEDQDDLIDGFILEAEDLFRVVRRALPEIDATPAQRDNVQQVRRSIHTFKGAAGVVGFHTASELARHMQDCLDEILEGERTLTPSTKDLFLATFGALDEFVQRKGRVGTFDQTAQTLAQAYATLRGEAATEVDMPSAVQPAPDTGASAYIAAAPEPGPEQPAPQPDTARAVATQASNVLRVPLDRVDELVRLVSELVISRSAYEQHLGRLTHQVDELRLSIERLRRTTTTVETQYEVRALADNQEKPTGLTAVTRTGARSATSGTAHEFDALEFDRYSEFTLVARELTETTADIGALGQEFGDVLGDFDSYLTRQARLTSEIQDKLMRLRMVPFATLATSLQRAVRVTARQRGKDVHLVLEGEAVEFDKTVLETMAEPLLHMLRNAVDHGIEAPEQRQALGKPAHGTIHLRVCREGTQVVLQMHDDGAGLDLQRLRATAVSAGMTAEAAAQLTVAQLQALIFQPGFSTAQQVSEVSGRGVGLDVVQMTVKRLKGQIDIDSVPGQGVTFTIRLPLTLAITRVFLLQVNDATFAIPLADVTQIVRLEPEMIERVDGTPVIRLDGQVVPVLYLGERLGLPATPDSPAGLLPMVVTQAGDRQVAFVVDQLLGSREVVVKTLVSHLRRVQGVSGCTLMGDGSVVLILHPLDLARHVPQTVAPTVAVPPRRRPGAQACEVLIVDDSFSVRRVVSNLIKSAGWQPVLARDGLEALELIQRSATLPDLILLDVEMPQMDGYELTSTLRAQAAYRDLPIVMLTSRAGEKHRRKALEVGATEYLVKPYQDEVLLGVIRRLAPRAGEVAAA
jgi:chemosensory pili system protein ChpA (sensor histidine kinase/response regulator)